MEDYAYILDYLSQGLPDERKFKRHPVAYGIGDNEFKLFELVPRPGATLVIGERVYIGKETETRDKIQHVKRRISYDELTHGAKSELPYVLEEIVKMREDRFVKFFNEAGAITTRYHALELLPGLGKKSMWAIIDERKKKPFESFQEIDDRVPTIHDPVKLIVKRIEEELSDPGQKYRLFVSR